jgi:hypothetical protein
MAVASDEQMQKFTDERIRPAAESFRGGVNKARDDKAAIETVFNRANGGAAWNDARIDGPPKLAESSDILVYNSIVSLWLKFVDGTATTQDSIDFHANWPIFQQMCVRPVGG